MSIPIDLLVPIVFQVGGASGIDHAADHNVGRIFLKNAGNFGAFRVDEEGFVSALEEVVTES